MRLFGASSITAEYGITAVLHLYSYSLKMLANFLFSFTLVMMFLEGTSWYFFVLSLAEEDTSSLGSVVFVSAVSILWCTGSIFLIFFYFNVTHVVIKTNYKENGEP